MARYDITQVNGVTKVETEKGFIYHFPLEIIETFTDADAMKRTQRGQTDSEYLKFSSIPNKLGAGNITGYVDAVAIGAYYFTIGGTSQLAIGTGLLSNNAQIEVVATLKELNKSMKEVIFLLKAIAE